MNNKCDEWNGQIGGFIVYFLKIHIDLEGSQSLKSTILIPLNKLWLLLTEAHQWVMTSQRLGVKSIESPEGDQLFRVGRAS